MIFDKRMGTEESILHSPVPFCCHELVIDPLSQIISAYSCIISCASFF